MTAAPSPEQYRRVFETFCANGDSVLCFTCSSKLSASYQSALIAKDMVEGKIDIIDTRTAALGSGMPVMDALEMIQAGKTHEEIAAACRSRGVPAKHADLAGYRRIFKRAGASARWPPGWPACE